EVAGSGQGRFRLLGALPVCVGRPRQCQPVPFSPGHHVNVKVEHGLGGLTPHRRDHVAGADPAAYSAAASIVIAVPVGAVVGVGELRGDCFGVPLAEVVSHGPQLPIWRRAGASLAMARSRSTWSMPRVRSASYQPSKRLSAWSLAASSSSTIRLGWSKYVAGCCSRAYSRPSTSILRRCSRAAPLSRSDIWSQEGSWFIGCLPLGFSGC